MVLKPRVLMVAYKAKDEVIVNLLRKLVETNDDGPNGEVVGTEDGSVKIVSWEEKVWRENKKIGKYGNKILLINDVTGGNQLKPVIDEKFNEYGVSYGFAGNQALIFADPTVFLEDKDLFKKFQEDAKRTLSNPSDIEISNIFIGALMTLASISLPASFMLGCIYGVYKMRKAYEIAEKIVQVQLMYGIMKLYKNDLDKFMKA